MLDKTCLITLLIANADHTITVRHQLHDEYQWHHFVKGVIALDAADYKLNKHTYACNGMCVGTSCLVSCGLAAVKNDPLAVVISHRDLPPFI